MQPPPLPIPTSQLTEKEGWVGVEVGNGGFPTTCNVESNLDEEDWELGLIWLQSKQGSSRGLAGHPPSRPPEQKRQVGEDPENEVGAGVVLGRVCIVSNLTNVVILF